MTSDGLRPLNPPPAAAVIPDPGDLAAERRLEARLRTTVLALAAGPAIGVGIARFGYALLLPDMAADLRWSYAQGGLVNAFNAFGYMLGALAAAPLIRRAGSDRMLVASTTVCVLTLFGSAFARGFDLIVLARLVTGVCGAFAFIAGADLTTRIAERSRQSAELLVGLFYIGPGFGILLTGLSLPPLQSYLGAGSWQAGWAALAGLSALIGCVLLVARLGPQPARPRPNQTRLRPMAALLVGYLVFAAGSISYMTFMITWIADHGASWGMEAAFWTVLGLAAVAAPWFWAGAFRRLSGGWPLAATILACGLGASIPLLTYAAPALLLSGAVFGSGFFASVATTTLFMKRNLSPEARPWGIVAATVAFGIGQTFGPMLTGAIADHGGGLKAGLGFGTGLIVLGALIAAGQRDLPHEHG